MSVFLSVAHSQNSKSVLLQEISPVQGIRAGESPALSTRDRLIAIDSEEGRKEQYELIEKRWARVPINKRINRQDVATDVPSTGDLVEGSEAELSAKLEKYAEENNVNTHIAYEQMREKGLLPV